MENQSSAQLPLAGKVVPIPKSYTSTQWYEELHHLPYPFIQTDTEFIVTGWNTLAEKKYGLNGSAGKNLFSLDQLGIVDGCPEKIKKQLGESGTWKGDIAFKSDDAGKLVFPATINYILCEKAQPVSALMTIYTDANSSAKEAKLAEAENTYQLLFNSVDEGILTLNSRGEVTACNKRAAEILNVPQDRIIGVVPISHSWTIYRTDGRVFPDSELPPMVTLQTGFPQRNVRMKLQRPTGESLWISVSSQALIREGEFNPSSVLVSFSDITEAVKNEEVLQKVNERYLYCLRLTCDSIWDIDFETNEVYRSEAFYPLSGYSPFQILPTMDWWFSKVHPEDCERVKKKIDECIRKQKDLWEDEYRFQCADGSYKHFSDTGLIQYHNKKPVRFIGVLRDITDSKK